CSSLQSHSRLDRALEGETTRIGRCTSCPAVRCKELLERCAFCRCHLGVVDGLITSVASDDSPELLGVLHAQFVPRSSVVKATGVEFMYDGDKPGPLIDKTVPELLA